MKKKLIFSGAATALITPFKDNEIDYNALSSIIEGQIKGKIAALVIGGTTGEAATLSDTERYELYSFVKEKAKGRVKLIFGTGTNDTRMAIKHTQAAEKIECDGVLVVTPYYNKGTFQGVTEHYKAIARNTSLPIILYNVPSRTGVNLTLKQLEELSKIDTVVGIKEAGDSTDRLVDISSFGDELYLYAGNDSQIYSTLALGGKGVISVISNLYPLAVSEICNHYFLGNTAKSLELQQKMLGFTRVMFLETNPSPIKYAMSLYGICEPTLRLPLLPPENATRVAIKNEISKLEGSEVISFFAKEYNNTQGNS